MIDNPPIDATIIKNLQDMLDTGKGTVEEILNRQSPVDEHNLEKLISCPHELVFNVKAHVLEENEKGEVIGTKEIMVKNYHIPVPPGIEYNKYMDSFFKFLENCILSAANHTQEVKDE